MNLNVSSLHVMMLWRNSFKSRWFSFCLLMLHSLGCVGCQGLSTLECLVSGSNRAAKYLISALKRLGTIQPTRERQNALQRGDTLEQNQPQRSQYSLQYTRTQVKNVYAIVVPSLLVRIKKSRVSTSAGAVLLIFFNIWLTLNLYEETICTKILKSMKSFQASNIKRLFSIRAEKNLTSLEFFCSFEKSRIVKIHSKKLFLE